MSSSRNFSLHSGERQTAADIRDIKKDRINRCEFVVSVIKKYFDTSSLLNGADVFCGNGYGSFFIS
ncbi:MAG: hypothetical protein LBV16_00445 [Elusimicrobiota bacterium]|nr:hypothetical protein [Elusimicrobiota bacterium]